MSVAHTFLFAVGNSMTTWGTLSQLPGVARDIDKVFDALVDGGPGFGLADRLRSVKLLDKGAREVKERWEEFIEAVEIDALVVFYFAGHGALVGEHDLRLLLADSKSSRKDESTLSVLQVTRTLENKGVAEWAVILDCCESGEATRDMAIQGARNRTNGGSLIVCATSSGSAWETPEHGGRFTSHLTEAIRTGSCMPPGAEFVDILRAATWAKDQLPETRPLVDHWGSADLRVARILPKLVETGRLPLSEVQSRRNAVKADPGRIARFAEALREHTEDVLEWNATLPSGARIHQPELERPLERLEEPDAHVTALLGEGGSGASTAPQKVLAENSSALDQNGTSDPVSRGTVTATHLSSDPPLTNNHNTESIRHTFQRCGPEALDSNSALYVAIHERDSAGDHKFRFLIKRTALSDSSTHLITGSPGTGKTTELFRIQGRLNQEHLTVQTQVVHLGAGELLNRSVAPSAAAILLLIGLRIEHPIRGSGILTPQRRDTGLRSWMGKILNLDLADCSSSPLGIFQRLQKAHHETLTKLTAEVFQRVSQAIAYYLAGIGESLDNGRLIITVDDLEKMHSSTWEGEDSFARDLELTFTSLLDLQLPCHVTYTFPHWLCYGRGALPARYDAEIVTVNPVQTITPDGSVSYRGLDILQTVVNRRIDSGYVFGEQGQELLVRLIQASGGNIRELLMLIREVLIRADSFPVPPSVVDRIIYDHAAALDRTTVSLSRQDLDIIREVLETRRIAVSSSKALYSLARLIAAGIILVYRNGSEWFSVHPLLLYNGELRRRAGIAF